MAEHTPGPWVINGRGQIGWRIDPLNCERTGLDFLNHPVAFAPEKADARLIAAPPDLLAAVKDLLDSLVDFKPVDGWHPAIATEQAARKAYERGLAVLAKAEKGEVE